MGLKSGAVPSLFGEECNMIVVEGQPGMSCIKIGLPRRINSQRLFSREYDFQKTFSLTEYRFSRKTYFYTIASSHWCPQRG